MGLIGDVTPGITQLSAQVPGILSALGLDLGQLGDKEQAIVAQLVAGLQAAEAQAGAVIQADLAPLLEELQACRVEVGKWRELLAGGFSIVPTSTLPKTS